MHPIYQNENDCLRCCVASIFELEWSAVPDFETYGTEWLNGLRTFITKLGYLLCVHENLSLPFMHYAIGVGPSPRGNWTHAVVIDEKYNIVHDPYQGGKSLNEIEYVLAFH